MNYASAGTWKMNTLRSRWMLSLGGSIYVLGCSADATTGPGQSGGASQGGAAVVGNGGAQSGGAQSGGAPGNGGQTAANGGSSGGLTSMGGAASGGSNASGGRAEGGSNTGTGGASGGRSSAGGSSSGGSSSGGSSAAGSSSMAGGSSTAVPSAGCGKSGRPANGTVTVSGDHIYDFPTSYDGNKPMPLLMGFHAAGNPIDHIKKLIAGSAFEMNYVRAFGKSAGNEWVYNTDINKVTKIYDELMSTYCIDKSRVFATGHSSGAQMIVQILTHNDVASKFAFKGVAPVAASNYGAISTPIPVLYIQGKSDNVRNSNGSDVVARFTAANKCMTSTMPESSIAGCNSTQNSAKVEPGCVTYQGCTKPTIWCSHNDPNYSSTNHGWPCFATGAIYNFFTGLQ